MATSKLRVAALFATVAMLGGMATAQPADGFRNLTAGGPLRHGVYGRIEIRGDQAPPVIYPQAITASEKVAPAGVAPLYLYVPTGQVRKWSRFCAQWAACDRPVLFVRMDESPGRWGRWRQLRTDVALR